MHFLMALITILALYQVFSLGLSRSRQAARAHVGAVLGLVMLSGSAVAQHMAGEAFPERNCLQDCSDDVGERQCPPACLTCACGAPLMRVPDEAPKLIVADCLLLTWHIDLPSVFTPSSHIDEVFRPPITQRIRCLSYFSQ